MSKSVLSAEHFHDEDAAFAFVEARLWPNGPVCPRCKSGERIGKLQGKTTRPGLYKCYACRKPFTVRIGTIFESSHLELHLWLQAIHLLCASKKGISSNQLARVLGITVKSAWFLSHRIREAMREGRLDPVGGAGAIVEADETYIGKKRAAHNRKPRGGYLHKRAVFGLVQRGAGVRTFHVERANISEIVPIIRENIARETHLMTDEARLYWRVGTEFAEHSAVQHALDEYVRGEVHTNTIEGCFSIFKRGMLGTYQHCGEKHLHRYLAEFDFRYNSRQRLGVNDEARAERALMGVVGKRLTYRTAGGQQATRG